MYTYLWCFGLISYASRYNIINMCISLYSHMILHLGNVLYVDLCRLVNVCIYVYDCLLYPSSGHSDSVWSVAISADGTKVISGSWDKTIKIWDAASGDVMQTLSGESDMLCVYMCICLNM